MAKKDTGVSLAQLNAALKQSDLQMNPAIAAQIQAAMAAPAAAPDATVKESMVQLTTAIKDNTVAITKGRSKSSQAADLSENELETRKVEDHQTDLLEKIEENTRGMGEGKAQKPEKENDKGSAFSKIGLLGTLIAVALGTIAGVLIAQARAMMTTLKFISKLIPESLVVSVATTLKKIPLFFEGLITKMMINVEYAFNLVSGVFKNRFPKAFQFVESAIQGFATFFKNMIEGVKVVFGKIGEAIQFVKTLIINFFKPIGEGLKLIKEGSAAVSGGVGKVLGFFNGIGEFFSSIGKWLGGFSKVFTGVTKVVSKLAYPITIIMGLFDGITEAIKGYEEGGIMGGIQGFISGALNSLVGSFLDLIKDMVSWVLDKLGFDDASEWLDSFSFSDMIKDFINAIFHPIDTIKAAFNSLIKWMASIKIPQFSVAGFKFGPWEPFKGLAKFASEQKTETPSADTAPKAEKTEEKKADEKLKTAPKESDATKVYNKSAENEQAKQTKTAAPKGNTTVTTQQINNQTQNAVIRSPVRNSENTLNSYLKTRFV